MELTREEVLRYLNLIRERKYLFVAVSLCIMSVIVWGSYFIPKKYMAKSVIFIERNVIEDLISDIAITPSMDTRIKVLRDTMLGRSLVLDVLRRLDLDTQAANDLELEEMIKVFQNKTNILVRRNNNLINVSFIDKDPELARNFVNSLVNEYVEENIFAKREEASDATRFLREQVAFFKEKMDKGESNIVKFRQEQGIFIAMDERSLINEIKEHKRNLEEIKIRKNVLSATKASIDEQLKQEEPFTTMYSTRGSEDTVLNLEKRLRQLLVRYTKNYPEVVKLKAEIELLKKMKTEQSAASSGEHRESEINLANPVYQELKQRVIEIEADIKALSARENQLNALVVKKKGDLKNIPENKKRLADMENERAYYADLYGKLLEKLGQSEVSKQMEIEDKATTFRIIESAILPQIPVSPNMKLLIMFGIVAGFAGGIGIVVLIDKMDSSIKSLDALKTLGFPVLAIIPRYQSVEGAEKIKWMDILLYGFAGLYFLCILGVLSMELFGITYVDELMNQIRINLQDSIKGILFNRGA